MATQADAPVPDIYVPAAHAVQPAEKEFPAKVPAGQAVHTDALPVEYVPAEQP